jgi:hypothetical protein
LEFFYWSLGGENAMSDLRQYVEENRGLLKKIELSIPGFRGYRVREDIRTADNILRVYIADKMETEIKKPVEAIREKLTKSLELDAICDVGECINQIKGLEAQIRHAEHGYSGISPQVRIEEDELNKIYEFDVTLLARLQDIQLKVQSLDNVILNNKTNELIMEIDEIKKQLKVFESTFVQRLQCININDNREG